MIKIGEFTITKMEGGNFWIQVEDGEGMELTEDEFTVQLDKMFEELF